MVQYFEIIRKTSVIEFHLNKMFTMEKYNTLPSSLFLLTKIMKIANKYFLCSKNNTFFVIKIFNNNINGFKA